jgi:hypothetical protein
MRAMDDPALDATLRRLPFGGGDPPDCDDGVLAAWVAGRLDGAGSEAVEAHLAGCRACRDLAVELRRGGPSAAALGRAEALLPKRRWPAFAAVAAAAAAMAVALLWPAAVPEYTVEGPFGGVQAHRDVPGEATAFLPYSRVRIDLAPREAGETAPLSVYASRPGGPLRAAPPAFVEAGPGGAWRVQFRADALLGPEPGTWEIHLVFGAAGDGLAGGPAPASPPRGTAWRRVTVEYRNEE